MNDFREKVIAKLGLAPDADDATILRVATERVEASRKRDHEFRLKVTAKLGIPSDSDDETILRATSERVEAMRKREAREVRLQAADRRAVEFAVQAAAQAPPGRGGQPVDMLGLPIPGIPEPVRISRGTPPEQWTEKQRQDAMLRRLGPQFHPGTEAPPAQDVWYQPSPNDHSIYVEGQGWQPNPDYRPGA